MARLPTHSSKLELLWKVLGLIYYVTGPAKTKELGLYVNKSYRLDWLGPWKQIVTETELWALICIYRAYGSISKWPNNSSLPIESIRLNALVWSQIKILGSGEWWSLGAKSPLGENYKDALKTPKFFDVLKCDDGFEMTNRFC